MAIGFASSFHVELQHEDDQISVMKIECQDNATYDVSIPWVPRRRGEHEFKVIADCYNQVNEAIESDNVLNFSIYIEEDSIRNRFYSYYLFIGLFVIVIVLLLGARAWKNK